MKGQQEAVSVILITGILIGVVGSIYFWGLPLIQKNKDISMLKDSERFMISLNDKIKSVANSGGREQIRIDLPGILVFDPQDKTLRFRVDTKGTIYDTGAPIPLSRNDCSKTLGEWGVDEPGTLCVESKGEAEDFFNTYSLKYIELRHPTRQDSYSIVLSGEEASGGENHDVIIENTGSNGGVTTVRISIN